MALNIMIRGQDLTSSVISSIGSHFGILGAGLAAIGVGAIATGVEATKMAADFQTAMLSNVAHAGLAKSEFDKVSQSVLQMSTAVGRSPTQLAEALYPILSAFSGIQNQSAKSAIALLTLKDSFQAVAGTTTDGTAVANAAVGTFNALGLATNNAATNASRMTNLFDVMDKTTQLGNMQWEAYKNVVSKLAVAIQGTGISFNESQAALAEMTNEGFSAQKASTYLSNTFTSLAIKTDALAAHAKKLKISFDENKYASLDFAGKIEYLNTVTDGNKQKLLALMGNNATALKTFNALSTGIDGYRSNLDALNHSQGALKSSFDTASQGFNFQMQQVKAAGDALMITLGSALLPVVSKLAAQVVPLIQQFTVWITKSGVLQQITNGLQSALDAIPGIISNVVGFFTNLINIGTSVVQFFQQNQWAVALLMVALGALGSVMALFAASAVANMILSLLEFGLSLLTTVAGTVTGAATMTATFGTMSGMIISSMGAAAVSIWATLGPFIIVGAVIAAVVVGIVLVVQHWGQIAPWLQGIWSGVVSWFQGAMQRVGSWVQGVIAWFNQWKTPILIVGGILLTFFGPALIQAGVKAAIAGAQIAGNFIKNMILTGAEATKNGAIVSFNFVKSMVQSGIEAVKQGAIVTGTFVKSMILTGAEAIKQGAIVTFNFIKSMIQAGIEGWASAGKLVASIIPAFIKTGAQAAWAGIQVAAKFVASLVQAGVQAVITGAKFLVSLIPAIISFAATSIAAAATAIPAMIAGFIAWSIGAWSAAVATIAATWPILLIILAIALLVVGIVLLVQHWGQVTAFLKTIWQAFTTWLMDALHAIGQFFVKVWDGIISFLKGAWAWIVSAAKIAFLALILIIGGPILCVALLIYTPFEPIKAFFAAGLGWG